MSDISISLLGLSVFSVVGNWITPGSSEDKYLWKKASNLLPKITTLCLLSYTVYALGQSSPNVKTPAIWYSLGILF
jgi:hypothetical protein